MSENYNMGEIGQVEKANKEKKLRREKELKDIKAILSMKEGKRFMWRLLAHCKTFESIWTPSAQIHYQAGQQDVGHFLMSEIEEADENLLFEMMKDNKQGVSDE